ncbi:hypothetical protein [Bosea sp. MMO-172]|uniref:hypothetical protein n=1 Tax=Bosea sp. MMO-172 TaxID=3127885 RepID=UPI00301743F0
MSERHLRLAAPSRLARCFPVISTKRRNVEHFHMGGGGAFGYALAIVVLTPGYQLFQSANNTTALAEMPKERCGTVSGLLNLSRNIGLIAGASGMGWYLFSAAARASSPALSHRPSPPQCV